MNHNPNLHPSPGHTECARSGTVSGTVQRGAPPAAEWKLGLHAVGTVNYLLQHGPDMINRCLRSGKPWEPGTLQIAQLLLGGVHAPVVVDVGANLGAFAVPMGQWLAAREGRLFAFEPQRLVYYQLCANLYINRLPHCVAHLLAVGARAGQIDVPVLDVASERNIGSLSLDPAIRQMQGTLSSRPTRSESVPMVTLDDFGLPSAHLVKIDVEGLELEVLTGAARWLESSGWPVLLFEVWGDYLPAYREKRERLLAFVQAQLGYQVFMMGELCIAQHSSRLRYDITRDSDQRVHFRPLAARTP